MFPSQYPSDQGQTLDFTGDSLQELSATENALHECPICSYSLVGLPRAHRCPECGFDYDEQTKAWKPGRFIAYAGTSLGALAAVGVALYFSVLLSWLTPQRTLAVALLVTLWGAAIASDLRTFFARPFVAVTGKGVLLRRRGPELRLIEWQGIASAETVRIGSRICVKLRLKDPHQAIEVTSMFGKRDSNARDFCELVNSYANASPHRA